nr:nucleotidyl transferase AbiEii/AbiGii toxin family protein [Bacteroidales bacterium]
YYCLKYVDYDSNNPDRILICPPDSLLPDWRADYETMQQSFIYGKSLPFDSLIDKIHILQDRFRQV